MAGLRFLLFLLLASPAWAESWTATISDDRFYDGGWANAPGMSVGMHCAAPKPGHRPTMDSNWVETTIPDPWHFVLTFSEQLFPGTAFQRDDVILFVDQTGYRLPMVHSNELAGGWEVSLSMTDPLYRALTTGQRMVIQVGTDAAWEIPMQGAGAAIAQVTGTCAATWQRTGHPAPTGVPQTESAPTSPASTATDNGFALPVQVTAYLQNRCNGPARIEEGGVQAGDLDRDGIPDVVLDWRGLLCLGETLSSYCGAANCEITIFLSTRGYANPVQWLAVGATIVPHHSGRLGLSMGGTASVCHAIDCSIPWLWNGTDLVQVP